MEMDIRKPGSPANLGEKAVAEARSKCVSSSQSMEDAASETNANSATTTEVVVVEMDSRCQRAKGEK